MYRILSGFSIRGAVEVVAAAVIVIAGSTAARPSWAEIGGTDCANEIGARCISSTYTTGQLAMKCPTNGNCKTCYSNPGNTCTNWDGSTYLDGLTVDKP
jgi:hypothetical protein